METGILILAMASIGYVMWWLVKNDAADDITEQTGVLRMPPPRKIAQEIGARPVEDRPAVDTPSPAAAPAPAPRPTDDVRWRERHRKGRRR